MAGRDFIANFFVGEVRFVSVGILNTKYSLVENGAIIKASNAKHIKLLDNIYTKYPESFKIMAPMTSVKIITGSIPDSYVEARLMSDYFFYHKKYYGF